MKTKRPRFKILRHQGDSFTSGPTRVILCGQDVDALNARIEFLMRENAKLVNAIEDHKEATRKLFAAIMR